MTLYLLQLATTPRISPGIPEINKNLHPDIHREMIWQICVMAISRKGVCPVPTTTRNYSEDISRDTRNKQKSSPGYSSGDDLVDMRNGDKSKRGVSSSRIPVTVVGPTYDAPLTPSTYATNWSEKARHWMTTTYVTLRLSPTNTLLAIKLPKLPTSLRTTF